VDYERPAITGTATLTLANKGRIPAREVPLLLNRLMSVRSVADDRQRSVRWTSAVSIFEDDPFKQVVATTVELIEPVPPGAQVVLRVSYEGPLVGYTETGSLYGTGFASMPFPPTRRARRQSSKRAGRRWHVSSAGMDPCLRRRTSPSSRFRKVSDPKRAHLGKGGTTAELIAGLSVVSGSKVTSAFLHDWMETSAWVGPVCSAPTFRDALARWR
jgi:hypothetical protein